MPTAPSTNIERLREHARRIGAKGRISAMNVPQLRATIARAEAQCSHRGETIDHKSTGFLNDQDATLCADCGAEL